MDWYAVSVCAFLILHDLCPRVCYVFGQRSFSSLVKSNASTWRSRRGVDGEVGEGGDERLDPPRAILGLGCHLGRALQMRTSPDFLSEKKFSGDRRS
jgi:hypothetical protein